MGEGVCEGGVRRDVGGTWWGAIRCWAVKVEDDGTGKGLVSGESTQQLKHICTAFPKQTTS